MYRPFASGVPDSRPFLDVESTIRGLSQDYSTAFNTGNYDQVAGLFSSDGLFMTPQREVAHGTKAIESLLRQYGQAGEPGPPPGASPVGLFPRIGRRNRGH